MRTFCFISEGWGSARDRLPRGRVAARESLGRLREVPTCKKESEMGLAYAASSVLLREVRGGGLRAAAGVRAGDLKGALEHAVDLRVGEDVGDELAE